MRKEISASEESTMASVHNRKTAEIGGEIK
jgi:hypothetical protein